MRTKRIKELMELKETIGKYKTWKDETLFGTVILEECQTPGYLRKP